MAAAKKQPTTKAKAKRLIVDVPEEVHRALKVRAAAEGVSIRDLVLKMLKANGIG